MRIEFLGCVIICAASLFVILSDDLNGAQLGLSVNYAVQVGTQLNILCFLSLKRRLSKIFLFSHQVKKQHHTDISQEICIRSKRCFFKR